MPGPSSPLAYPGPVAPGAPLSGARRGRSPGAWGAGLHRATARGGELGRARRRPLGVPKAEGVEKPLRLLREARSSALGEPPLPSFCAQGRPRGQGPPEAGPLAPAEPRAQPRGLTGRKPLSGPRAPTAAPSAARGQGPARRLLSSPSAGEPLFTAGGWERRCAQKKKGFGADSAKRCALQRCSLPSCCSSFCGPAPPLRPPPSRAEPFDRGSSSSRSARSSEDSSKAVIKALRWRSVGKAALTARSGPSPHSPALLGCPGIKACWLAKRFCPQGGREKKEKRKKRGVLGRAQALGQTLSLARATLTATLFSARCQPGARRGGSLPARRSVWR